MNGKRRCVPLALAIALLTMAGLLGLVISASSKTACAQGTIHYVASGGNCGGASPCYSIVQDAVDAAQPGDEIRIAAGTYTDINNQGGLAQVVYIDKDLTLRGGYTTTDWTTPDPDANRTELNANALGRVMFITGPDVDVTVEGLRLTYGNASGLGGQPNPPFSDQDAGGGLYVLEATVTLSHTSVLSSATSSSGVGGGVYMRQVTATVINCTIQGNSSKHGGGLYLNTVEATLQQNTIQGNIGTGTSNGLGVNIRNNSSVTLLDNTIQNNTSSFSTNSGTVYIKHSDATLSGNLIANNTYGHGVYAEFGDITLTDNTIQGNSNTGVAAFWSDTVLTDNTIDDNGGGFYDGGGVCIDHLGADVSSLLERNLIQNNHTADFRKGAGVYLDSRGKPITLTGNIIQDNVAGTRSINPIYAGSGGGVYLTGEAITLRDNIIQRNVANQYCHPVAGCHDGFGGGMYLSGPATLINNIITDNRAGDVGSGIYVVGASPNLYHNTIANNTGGSGWDGTGVYVVEGLSGQVAQPKLYNTIIANQATGVYVSGGALNVATIDGVLWWGNSADTSGGGGFTITNEAPPGNPAFVNPGGYDYHITGPGSAAIDAGINAGITDDVDGESRPHYDGYDLGADEWWPLVVVKRATPDTAEPGDVVTYTLTLTNITGAAMTVSLTDTLPSQVSYVGPLAYNNGSGSYDSGVITWAGTVLTAMPTVITCPVQVAPDVPYGTTITNTATVRDAYDTFQTDPGLILVSRPGPGGSTEVYLPAVLKSHP
jgi:uncharacterized repeat protein (TIGR01451 family)